MVGVSAVATQAAPPAEEPLAMSIHPPASLDRETDYPTTDGRPLAETDWHRQITVDLIEILQARFAADPEVSVSGNLLLFYEPGNRRKHVSPDVFVVRGVPKGPRPNYLTWQEGKGPDLVIEITSRSTQVEDQKAKLALYRDVLHVPEYFLFDPFEDYLVPPFQGWRLSDGDYAPIPPVEGRLPSLVLGLHLERSGAELRLYDPATGQRLLTAREEVEQLRREVEALRRQHPRNGA
jgi:Uma2 family endonuclease